MCADEDELKKLSKLTKGTTVHQSRAQVDNVKFGTNLERVVQVSVSVPMIISITIHLLIYTLVWAGLQCASVYEQCV